MQRHPNVYTTCYHYLLLKPGRAYKKTTRYKDFLRSREEHATPYWEPPRRHDCSGKYAHWCKLNGIPYTSPCKIEIARSWNNQGLRRGRRSSKTLEFAKCKVDTWFHENSMVWWQARDLPRLLHHWIGIKSPRQPSSAILLWVEASLVFVVVMFDSMFLYAIFFWHGWYQMLLLWWGRVSKCAVDSTIVVHVAKGAPRCSVWLLCISRRGPLCHLS